MNVVTTKLELITKINRYKERNQTIGFVPTMGYLHEGHMKLLEEARKDNDIVVLSIFVNPLQFGVNEDYDSYPRNQQRDEELAKLSGVDLLFSPSVPEIYPTEPSYTVKVQSRVNVLCGRSRKGHFDGVATILTKLFNLIKPDRAYFGMKDAQQVAVIDGLITEFYFPIELVSVPTIREADGLAKSSRNVKLNEKDRNEAPVIYKSLSNAKNEIAKGERDKEKLKALITTTISQETDGEIDYIEILSYPNLEEIEVIRGKVIIAIAVKFTNARLIDNITIEVK
ncbi:MULTISPECIES: pantoate--beta-alanine ligase [Metabacillus]|uniref:Pantothenate synthetase n=2 Tax=Metabacillus TaxID=2675233 RepID=A0A179SYG4_9BACI|nr:MULTISPECIES: pantoate--beta-alanine ligase [Metabacillus]OAS86308.1 pantoate--beta-alanine ligase [Metabacillus litoralis]QNF30645.1 pantoate--beta-alanine ligase [Metabacillus sp. KUDC1714]